MANPFESIRIDLGDFNFKSMFISEGRTFWERTMNQIRTVGKYLMMIVWLPIGCITAAAAALAGAIIAICLGAVGLVLVAAEIIVRTVTIPFLTVLSAGAKIVSLTKSALPARKVKQKQDRVVVETTPEFAAAAG